MSTKKTLIPLALVMMMNALGYGIIFPLLYPYSSRFGIGPIGLAALLAVFSLAQFISTPVIGRLADRYGRRSLLILSMLGTALSFVMFALAQNALMLFVARILDGITGGNISVAQAVIADSTKGADRAKAFGILGASFGFGFLVGPAIGGLLGNIDLTYPFWFAAFLAMIAVGATYFLLPETLVKSSTKVHEPLFRFSNLFHALVEPQIGPILLVTFLTALGFNAWILGFQTFTVDSLHLGTRDIGLLFALAGVVNIIMQSFGIRWILSKIPSKKNILLASLVATSLSMATTYFTRSLIPFATLLFVQNILVAPQGPVAAALLSERTKAEDQGGMMGINQSYMSLGQILGPIVGGLVASVSVPVVFLVSALGFVAASSVVKWFYHPEPHKTDL